LPAPAQDLPPAGAAPVEFQQKQGMAARFDAGTLCAKAHGEEIICERASQVSQKNEIEHADETTGLKFRRGMPAENCERYDRESVKT
jgi:hypothetical protein